MYIYIVYILYERRFDALSYGYPMGILWLSYGAGCRLDRDSMCLHARYKNILWFVVFKFEIRQGEVFLQKCGQFVLNILGPLTDNMQDFGEIFIKFKEKCARACICAKKAVTLQRKRRMNHEDTIFRRDARSNG